MIIQPNIADALIRNDLRYAMQASFRILNPGDRFVWSPYLALIADAMERVRRGELKRVIFNVSPRLGKSTAITVTANAWLMGRNPSLKTMVTSYGEDLISHLSKHHKTLVTSPTWMRAFPEHRIDPHRSADNDFETTARGARKAASIFGSLTGYGANIIFIDDPHKGAEANSANARENVISAFENGVASRLNDKENGVIIVVMQRFHEEDLTGYLIEKGGFTVINLPAIAIQDEHFPMLDGQAFVRRKGELLCEPLLNHRGLDNARRDHGLAIYEAQYQQNPTASGANLVDWSWFDPFDEPLEQYLYTFQSWDIAITDKNHSHYSACVTMGFTGDKLHLLDVYRAKLQHHELLEKILFHQRAYRAHRVIVERAGVGEILCQDLRRHPTFPLTPWAPKGNKEVRLAASTGYLAKRVVQIPRQASWLEGFYKELMGFPAYKHDDQVDAFSQAMEFARLRLDVFVDTMLHNGRRSEMTTRRGATRRTSLRERILASYEPGAPSLASRKRR